MCTRVTRGYPSASSLKRGERIFYLKHDARGVYNTIYLYTHVFVTSGPMRYFTKIYEK